MNTMFCSFIFLAMLCSLGLSIRTAIGTSKSNFLSCAVVGVLGGLVVGWLGNDPEFEVGMPLGFCLVMVSLLTVLLYSSLHKRRMQDRVARASEVQRYCEDNFHRLDLRGVGLITRQDLFEALESMSAARDRSMMKVVDRDFHLIGHVLHTHVSISPMSGGVAYLHTYGISREDLASWPERVKKLYHREFGDEPTTSLAD